MFFGSVGIGTSWPAPFPVLPGGPAATPLPAAAGCAAAGSDTPASMANVANRIVIQVIGRRLGALISCPPGHPRLAGAHAAGRVRGAGCRRPLTGGQAAESQGKPFLST